MTEWWECDPDDIDVQVLMEQGTRAIGDWLPDDARDIPDHVKEVMGEMAKLITVCISTCAVEIAAYGPDNPEVKETMRITGLSLGQMQHACYMLGLAEGKSSGG